MRKSYSYYAYFGISSEEIELYNKIINDVKNGVFNEKEIRYLNNEKALKYVISEMEYDVFIAIIRPFSYEKDGNIRRRYLVDPFTNDIVSFINGAYTSFSEAIYAAQENGVHANPEEIVANSLVILEEDKKRLIDAIYESYPKKDVDMNVIEDVLARQISGWGYPIRSTRDIIYYSEIPNIYPSIELFNKNIMTTYNDTAGCYDDKNKAKSYLEIRISYDTLDDENKLYADLLVKRGIAKKIEETSKTDLSIFVPCQSVEYVGEVSNRMFNVLAGFKKQDMIYGRLSFDDVVNKINSFTNHLDEETYNRIVEIAKDDIDDPKLMQIMDIIGIPYYYDIEEKQFWIDEYYCKKHKEYIQSQRVIDTHAKLEKKILSE